jgi:phosphoribosylformylglycinamidine synthase subunit PurL
MLSESQERMLMVLKPEKEPEAEAIFRKWGLDFAIIGKTTDTRRFVIRRGGEVKADLPIKDLGDEAPLYDRPWIETPRAPVLAAASIKAPMPTDAALIKLLASPDLCSKRWIAEQYDTLILGNTVQGPGGDAAVVRLGDGPKGLALTTDCTERYCAADPREGGKQAVAEAWRNLIAVGARPLALTDNLNFGNPERPEAMGQLVGCIEGIGEAARALDFPVVSGNVSLYNETMGSGIPPTPAIGGVGLVEDVAKTASLAFKAAGEDIWLVGGAPSWLGRSAWLATIAGREEGAPPPVDLLAERRNGEFVASLIRNGSVSAVHDLSDGGLAVALAEMAMAGGMGGNVEAEGLSHAFFFGEDQGRYVLTAPAAESAAIAEEAKRLGVPLSRIGVTGGETLRLGKGSPVALAALVEAYENWLPNYMSHPQGANS